MNNLRELYQEITRNARFQAEIKAAKQAFEHKPIVIEFAGLARMARIAKPGFGLFSIVTGFACLFFALAENLAWPIAGLFSVAGLVVVELAKTNLLGLALRRAYQSGASTLNLCLIFAGLTFTGLSVFLSVTGASQAYQNLDRSQNELQARHQAQNDSLIKAYTDREKAIKSELAAFTNSVSWQGKVNVSDPTVSATLSRYNAQLSDLNRALATDKATLNRNQADVMTATKKESGFNLTLWLGISGANELLILTCIWFLCWYAYNVAKEQHLVFAGQTYTVSASELHSFARLVSMQAQALPISTGTPIGFGHSLPQEKTTNLQEPSPTPAPLNKNESGLIAAIKSGITDYRTLTKFGANPKQIAPLLKKFSPHPKYRK